MAREGTKEAAEAVLRELPSVIGAFVREDVNGHPREVHLLVRPGPNARHLAYDVRDLLEERLGIPVDQRVISIAQLSPGRKLGPILSEKAGIVEQRARVNVELELDGDEKRGEAISVDTMPARVRAAATATLQCVDAMCVGRARFEVEHVSLVSAFDREYVLVTALVSSPFLGRKPVQLVGAQPIEVDAESAAVLACLKAVNRTLSLVLRLADGSRQTSPRKARR